MTPKEIAHKYVHGEHDALTDNQEKKDMSNDIRELLIDFLDDVLMCQDEGATIVDREKYVDDYL